MYIDSRFNNSYSNWNSELNHSRQSQHSNKIEVDQASILSSSGLLLNNQSIASNTTSSTTPVISQLGQLNNSLFNLQNIIQTLNNATSTNSATTSAVAQQVTSSDTSILTATSSGTAIAGDHSVTVNKLAISQQLNSTDYQTTDKTFGGSLVFQNAQGTTSTIKITANSSLDDVANAINSANNGITAKVNFDGIDNHLNLASSNGGNFSVTGIDSGSSTHLSSLNYSANQTGIGWLNVIAGQNAQLSIDGKNITSSSNTVTDPSLAGVTLNLLKASANPVSLSIANPSTSSVQSGSSTSNSQTLLNTSNLNSILANILTDFNNSIQAISNLPSTNTKQQIHNDLNQKLIDQIKSDPAQPVAQVVAQPVPVIAPIVARAVDTNTSSPVVSAPTSTDTIKQVASQLVQSIVAPSPTTASNSKVTTPASSLGIAVDSNGKLTLDSTKLNAAIKNPTLLISSLSSLSNNVTRAAEPISKNTPLTPANQANYNSTKASDISTQTPSTSSKLATYKQVASL